MAKEKIKQWAILVVVAPWLLTTLSACGGARPFGKVASLETDFRYGRISAPTYVRDSHELIYVEGQSCPDELFGGSWVQVTYPANHTQTFSQTTDRSGVQEITQKIFLGLGMEVKQTYIVDGKLHDEKVERRLLSNPTYPKYIYAASCNFKLKDFNYKVFRVVKNYAQGAKVEDYIVGGKLEGVSILGHRSGFTSKRRLELENSVSVATSYDGLYGKE